MGHLRLGNLPKTESWQTVVGLVANGSSASEIAAAVLDASKKGLRQAPDDPAFVHAFWLLTQIPAAAHEKNFASALRSLDLAVSDSPSLLEIVSAFSNIVDQKNKEYGRRNDLSEIAQLAAAESLTAVAGAKTDSLFGVSAESVQGAFKGFSYKKQFSHIAHDFFSRVTKRYLTYYLSRELSNHVGPGKRFANIDKHGEFKKALEVHCRQTARIMEEFAGGWFSKNTFEGGIDHQSAKGFVYFALKKIRSELTRRGRVNGT